jgi:dsRNA-specific ribonuclease
MAHINPKNELQKQCRKIGLFEPEYKTEFVGTYASVDPSVNRALWQSTVTIPQIKKVFTLEKPYIGSKKGAEKKVAQHALEKLREDPETRLFFVL